MKADKANLQDVAHTIGDRWAEHPYYDNAEKGWEKQFNKYIKKYLGKLDLKTTVDLAAGHGRNSAMLLPLTKKLYIVDINKSNIDFCKERFGKKRKITYIVNNGYDLSDIKDSSVTAVYTWDSLVHFDSDLVRSYLREFSRILKPGGRAFIHHSNNTTNPTGFVYDKRGGRNFMSIEQFANYCYKENLEVLEQEVFNWAPDIKDSDAITLLEKPKK